MIRTQYIGNQKSLPAGFTSAKMALDRGLGRLRFARMRAEAEGHRYECGQYDRQQRGGDHADVLADAAD
jgi:hypothetical protein